MCIYYYANSQAKSCVIIGASNDLKTITVAGGILPAALNKEEGT